MSRFLRFACNDLASWSVVQREDALKTRQDIELEWSGLMRAAMAGDQAAYRTLLTSITPHVRGVAKRRLSSAGGSADIEDIVQETLLAVHLKRATWDPTQPFTPWLSAVARHKAIDAFRRKGGRIEVEIGDVIEDLAQPPVDEDRRLDVETALGVLNPRQRTIVELISLEGRTAAEVGTALDMSESSVRVTLHRALKAMSLKLNGTHP
jgi:RNA polymerase sigma factor (sigma-70 family)